MPDYKNGKIYTIRCKNDNTLIYVGSTVQPLFKRWYKHKTRANNEKYNNIKLYQKIRETNIDDWYIELYENCPCENKEQLNKREGEVIREISTINKYIAGRTKKEYYEDNKGKIVEQRKKKYEANKDKIKESSKQFYETNKDKVKEYMKQYRKVNGDKIKEYMNQYNEANKELISQKRKQDYQRKKQEQQITQ